MTILRQADEQESVAIVIEFNKVGAVALRTSAGVTVGTKLYTSPSAQREWIGLTEDDVASWELPNRPTLFEFAKFVEAKLKEKNT